MKPKQLAKEAVYYGIGVLNRQSLIDHDFIFMLAMPRSGSTLLTHILDSSDSIVSIGETKTAYESERDLIRMVGKLRAMQWRHKLEREKHTRYFMEKVVHNRLLLPEHLGFLKDDRYKVIFLIREPVGVAKSLIRVMDNMDEEGALKLYIRRATALKKQATILGVDKECVVIDYGELLQCTRPVLSLLENYLELPDPLDENYRVTPITGRFNLGDKSEEIASGRIVRSKSKSDPSDHNFPADLLAEAQAVYQDSLAAMRAVGLHVQAADCSK